MPRWMVLFALLVSAITVAQDDVCRGQGGTAHCLGPVTAPYFYQVSDGTTSANAFAESEAIAAYETTYRAALQPIGFCSFSMVDNRPALVAASPGTGGFISGDYAMALFGGVGQYLNVGWNLSTDETSQQIPLRVTAVFGHACQYSGTHGAYVSKTRTVMCPIGYWPNATGIPGSYCYRIAEALDAPKNYGQQCPIGGSGGAMIGNPINSAIGNKFQAEVDYAPGASPLQFVRYYNNRLWTGQLVPGVNVPGHRSALGPNWRSTYDRSISFTNSVTHPVAFAYRQDGRTLHFHQQNGVFVADDDIADRLEQVINGSGVMVGWRYTAANSEDVETYDVNGRLASIRTRRGEALTLDYSSDGRLSQVTDSFGRALSFSYDTNGALTTVTDPNSRTYTYTYGSSRNVASVTYPDNTTRTYLYGLGSETQNTGGALRPFALTGIVDELSNRYATFKYDGSEMAVSTEHAGGVEKYTLENLGTQTVVTDPLGQVRVHSFNRLHGMARMTTATWRRKLTSMVTGPAMRMMLRETWRLRGSRA